MTHSDFSEDKQPLLASQALVSFKRVKESLNSDHLLEMLVKDWAEDFKTLIQLQDSIILWIQDCISFTDNTKPNAVSEFCLWETKIIINWTIKT